MIATIVTWYVCSDAIGRCVVTDNEVLPYLSVKQFRFDGIKGRMLITGLRIKPANSDMVIDFQLLPTEVEVCQKQIFAEQK